MEGYNILIPDICKQVAAEITLGAMDAMQDAGHTPVVMSMQSIAAMYQDYRYAKHGCYEIFAFHFKQLMADSKIDMGFSAGLIGVFEDLAKAEAHNLLEEAGIPNVVYLHGRDLDAARKLETIGAPGWKQTVFFCTSKLQAARLVDAGMRQVVHGSPVTSLRLFYQQDVRASSHAFPVLSDDPRLTSGFDVCFCGSMTGERAELLRALGDSGVALAIFGDRGWESSSVSEYFRGYADYLTQLNTVYNSSKIVLDLKHAGTELGDYVSPRVIDALAARSMVVSYRREDFPDFLDAEFDISTFDGAEELVQAVKHYLRHEVDRHTVAGRGHFKVRTSCTWKQQLTRLLPRLEMCMLSEAR